MPESEERKLNETLTFAEAGRLIEAMRERVLHGFTDQAEIQERLAAMEAMIATFKAGFSADEPATLYLCFGWGGENCVALTFAECQALQRVARAQLEIEARRQMDKETHS